MKVLKFGGSSLGTPERIKSVIQILRGYNQKELTLVCSAFGGVTDQLIKLSELAYRGDQSYKQLLKTLEIRHLDATRALIGVAGQTAVLTQVKYSINELEDMLHGIFLVRERTPRTLDYIMSFGERLSAFIIAEAIKDAGLPAAFLDARKVIKTDDHLMDAMRYVIASYPRPYRKIREDKMSPLEKAVAADMRGTRRPRDAKFGAIFG